MEAWTPSGQPTSRPFPVQNLIGQLGAFFGLSAMFVLVASVPDAVREYSQKSWPQVTAIIERCSVDANNSLRSHRKLWYIECRIRYQANSDGIETSIQSRTSSGWSGDADEGMLRWVDHHRAGSHIVVHYDPNDHKTAVLAATDMPFAGPRTPNNLKLLLVSAGSWIGLVVIAKRGRSPKND